MHTQSDVAPERNFLCIQFICKTARKANGISICALVSQSTIGNLWRQKKNPRGHHREGCVRLCGRAIHTVQTKSRQRHRKRRTPGWHVREADNTAGWLAPPSPIQPRHLLAVFVWAALSCDRVMSTI